MVWLYFSDSFLFLFFPPASPWFFFKIFLSYRPSFSPSSSLHRHRSSSFWLWHSVRPAGGSSALLTVGWMTSPRRGLWVGNMRIVWKKYLNVELRETETNGGTRWRESFDRSTFKNRETLFIQNRFAASHQIRTHRLLFWWSECVSLRTVRKKRFLLNVLLLLAAGDQRQQIHNAQRKVEDVHPEYLHSYWTTVNKTARNGTNKKKLVSH